MDVSMDVSMDLHNVSMDQWMYSFAFQPEHVDGTSIGDRFDERRSHENQSNIVLCHTFLGGTGFEKAFA